MINCELYCTRIRSSQIRIAKAKRKPKTFRNDSNEEFVICTRLIHRDSITHNWFDIVLDSNLMFHHFFLFFLVALVLLSFGVHCNFARRSIFNGLFIVQFAVRLSERNGDLGKGILEIYKVNQKKWVPACVDRWSPATSPTMVCSLLGYNSVNSSRLTMPNTNQTLPPPINSVSRMYQRKKNNLIKEFGNCKDKSHAIVDLTCSNYGKNYYL